MGTMIPIPRSQVLSKNSAYATTMTASRNIPENVLQEDDWERDPSIYNHCGTRIAMIEA